MTISLLEISEEASTYIAELLSKNNKKVLLVQAIKGGCSGTQFKFSMEEGSESFDNQVPIKEDYTLCVAASALLFVIGSTLAYKKTPTGSMLIFEKANMKGQCGCGKSFY